MIRRYNKNDIPAIVDLELLTLNDTLGEEMLTNNLENEMSYYFVYELDNQIVAYISTAFDGSAVEIMNFCTLPNKQNKGLGQELLMYVMDYFYNLGATSLVLEVRASNTRAIHVYEKQGFVKIHTRKAYYSNGEDALVLQKINITISEMNDAYKGLYCDIDIYEDYVQYSDDVQSDKFCHNYYFLKNNEQKLFLELYNENKEFIQYESLKPIECPGMGFEVDHTVMLHTMINNLHMLVDKPHKIITLDESNKDLFYKVIFEDESQFGIEYAKAETKRVVESALKGEIQIFASLTENDEIAGVMETYIFNNCAEVQSVWVYDKYQHQGHATQMFKYAKELFISRGVYDVIICAEYDDTPKNMYKNMGFNKALDIYEYHKDFKEN